MLRKVCFLMVLLLGVVPLVWAGTVSVNGVEEGTLQDMSVTAGGDVVITTTTSGGGGSTCDETVVVSPASLAFTVTKGSTTNPTGSVSVKDSCTPANNLAFTVTSTPPSWLAVSPTSGNGTLDATVSASAITHSTSAVITMNVQGAAGAVSKSVNVAVTYSDPSQTPAPRLVASDPNMWSGEAKGTQTVLQGGQLYYKFDLPGQCNRVDVKWTSFDWEGRVDMIVKKGSLPTLADWNSAVAAGYPSASSGPTLWYNLIERSGGGGETSSLSYVSAGTYYILMKNTNGASSQFKVWYTPNCTSSR